MKREYKITHQPRTESFVSFALLMKWLVLAVLWQIKAVGEIQHMVDASPVARQPVNSGFPTFELPFLTKPRADRQDRAFRHYLHRAVASAFTHAEAKARVLSKPWATSEGIMKNGVGQDNETTSVGVDPTMFGRMNTVLDGVKRNESDGREVEELWSQYHETFDDDYEDDDYDRNNHPGAQKEESMYEMYRRMTGEGATAPEEEGVENE